MVPGTKKSGRQCPEVTATSVLVMGSVMGLLYYRTPLAQVIASGFAVPNNIINHVTGWGDLRKEILLKFFRLFKILSISK